MTKSIKYSVSYKIPKVMRAMKRIRKKKNSGKLSKLTVSKLEEWFKNGYVVMREVKKVDSETRDCLKKKVDEIVLSDYTSDENSEKKESGEKDVENEELSNEYKDFKEEFGEYAKGKDSDDESDMKYESGEDDDSDLENENGEVEEWTGELSNVTVIYGDEEDEEPGLYYSN